MKSRRRKFLQFAVAAAALALSRSAIAQVYPTRPITMIVPAAAGGPLDVVGRVLSVPMRGSLGQPVIIENLSGADGSIGTGRAARAKPDGYTIDLGFMGGNVLNGAFYSLPYDALNDLVPISPLATTPLVLFSRRLMPAKDLNELVIWLKANPRKASAGIASVERRLVAALFQRETGTQFTLIPYRGTAPAMQDLVAGQIDLLIDTPVQLPLVRTGSIKAYAVTSDARMSLAPDIPSFTEMGLPTLAYSQWFGLFAPKGTPREVIAKLNLAIVEALADVAVRSRFVELGLETFPRDQQTPGMLGAMMEADAKRWWPIIKEFGIKPE
ncbi:MAG: tripartite tricarboxylate transporter substrate binding protein BugD [Alphaproteobacteria bacterium]|nr:tripartite tricarboxylate transporter substrate binding protein BugD [Alphaproteobacteria bacterium]